MNAFRVVILLTVSVCASSIMIGCARSSLAPGPNMSGQQTLSMPSPSLRNLASSSSDSDLLYVESATQLLVYSFPQVKLLYAVKNTWALNTHAGLCSDKNGNVYLAPTTVSPPVSIIYEIRHGATSPFRTLNDPGAAFGCAVDPVTGDLAVANIIAGSNSPADGNLVVFRKARGKPAVFSDPDFTSFLFCSYDEDGNLFADNQDDALIGELPKGGHALAEIALSQSISPSAIQWDGTQLAIAGGCCGSHGDIPVYQVQIYNGVGAVSGPTLLAVAKNRRQLGLPFGIQGNFIVGPDHGRRKYGNLYLWPYPDGGKPIRSVHPSGGIVFGVAVSIAGKNSLRADK